MTVAFMLAAFAICHAAAAWPWIAERVARDRADDTLDRWWDELETWEKGEDQ